MAKLTRQQVIQEYTRSTEKVEYCALCQHSDFAPVVDHHTAYGDTLHHVICKNCGFIMINPRPTEDTIEKYYSDYGESLVNSNTKGEDFRDKKNWEHKIQFHQWQVEHLQKFSPLDTKGEIDIFELGFGPGLFMHEICNVYNVGKAVGAEPGAPYMETARHFNPDARFVVTDKWWETDIANERFDLVYCNGVIEHLTDPMMMLYRLKNILKPNGVIYLAIPNSWSPNMEPNAWYPLDHFYSFNRRTAEYLCRAAGINPLRMGDIRRFMLSIIGQAIHAPSDPAHAVEFQGRIENFHERFGNKSKPK